jgi:EAL and modified HD-GYP domain-containing signal transduction protein
MNLFIARQPIFDRENTVYGYELLYREESKIAYDAKDGDMASSSVIITGFVSMGLEKLTGGKKAFVNFTENLVIEGVATIFPKEHLVVEILETIEPTKEVLEACKKLKKLGYIIALDDFVFKPGYEKLVELADIIKVDFLLSSEEERRGLLRRFGKGKIKFLAEKIETVEEYKKAYEQGYSYFQGYYFSKPTTVTANIVPPNKMNYFQLIKEINSEEINFSNLGNIIERDVAFSYEMLKLVNSAAYCPVSRIKSIRQAISFLGEQELKKWVYVSVLRKISKFKDDEIVESSMVRAKALEQICDRLYISNRKSEFVTLGMISMLDVLMGISIDVILEQVAVSDEIKNTLLRNNKGDIMNKCFEVVLAYEKGNWEIVMELAGDINIKVEELAEIYYQSLLWSQKLKATS